MVLLLPRFELEPAKRLWLPALAAALIVLGGVIGTLVASSSEISSSAEVGVRFALASFGAMLLVACWRPDVQAVKSFSWLWIAGGIVSAIVAFTIPDLHRFLRPSGLTPHPTHLAIISMILFGVALGLVVSDRRRYAIWSGLAAAAVLFAAIVVSGSRAGLLAGVVVAILVLAAAGEKFASWAKANRTTVGIVVVAVGIALVLFSFVAGDRNAFDRAFGGDTGSDQARDVFNEEAWDRFKGDPITGVGFADAGNAHNFFLQVGSAAGVLGLVGALTLIVLALRSYWVAGWKRMSEDPVHWGMAAALAASVIGYLVMSVFQNVLWDRNIWIAIVLMTWTCTALARGDGASEAGTSS